MVYSSYSARQGLTKKFNSLKTLWNLCCFKLNFIICIGITLKAYKYDTSLNAYKVTYRETDYCDQISTHGWVRDWPILHDEME